LEEFVAGDVPTQYKDDFNYLQDKARKGQLYNDNAIYKKLAEKAHHLPGLQRALNSLELKYK
jgi:hypothetical protein